MKFRISFLNIINIVLLLVGVILLCLSIFGENKSTSLLALALVCILVSNIINIAANKKKK